MFTFSWAKNKQKNPEFLFMALKKEAIQSNPDY